MTTEVIKKPRVSANLPPRTLNVQKFAESRASELESLHSIITDRLNNDFRSCRNKRRRTTGYDNRVAKNRWRKRRKLEQIDKGQALTSASGLASEGDQKKAPRRIRRRIELRKNLETGFFTSGDGTKRLRTHLWHAKRFTMTKQWGFHLPLGLQGRGRGSRALLKWFKHGAVVHDASYCSAVQLEGPEDLLLAVLRMVLVPAPSVNLEEIPRSVLSGVSYGSAMLHHVGGPFSQPVAPVTYMWQPVLRQNIDIDIEKDIVADGSQGSVCRSLFRKLWVWIHAAALSEGYDTLKFACERQMDETGVSVKFFLLEGQLAKLEILGTKAHQILQRILRPVSGVTSTLDASSQLRKCSTVEADTDHMLQKSVIFDNAEYLPSHSILSLIVHDPRDLPEKGIKRIPEAPSAFLRGDAPDDQSKELAALGRSQNKNKEFFSLSWVEPEENSVIIADSKDFWNMCNGINPPVEESLLCMEKHQQRLTYFNLENTNAGTLVAKTKEQSSRPCPILLLKNNNQRDLCIGWSIILPLGWVKAFWVPLVSNGAHAIGLREKHWIACDVGLPFFPFDFPDCKAYTCFMATEAIAADKKAELRPLAMRPLRVPIPPPWDSVRFAFKEDPARTGDVQSLNDKRFGQEMVQGNSSVDSVPRICDLASRGQYGSSFEGFVARTFNKLSDHLNEVHGGQFLLFLDPQLRKMGFSKLMKDEGKLSQVIEGANMISVDRKLCFLRVHLHAYKEGVFEEGAVVCVPHLNDLLIWTSRLNEQDGGIQIPQSSIGSYFKQQSSGRWELQIPEDPIARDSHRWPIGFVTTGFVRGSTKPLAEALCEATLLAQLRREQWNEMSKKRRRRGEIFVLVRNLRSAAYRLGVATIVLEQQQEDLVFI